MQNTFKSSMNYIKKISLPLIFTKNIDKKCKTIENICVEQIRNLGIQSAVNVTNANGKNSGIYIVQIFSKSAALMKAKNIALINSLLAKKSAIALGEKPSKVTLLLNITDPQINIYLNKANRLSIKNIEYLLSKSIAKQTTSQGVLPAMQTPPLLTTVVQIELDTCKSISVVEIEFEEYLSVATKKPQTKIAEKRGKQKSNKQDAIYTVPMTS